MSAPSLNTALRALGLLLLGCSTSVAVAAATPDWQPYAPSTLEQARRNGRLLMIEVTADWCAACRRMDKIGFRDPRVLSTLKRHYVPVRVDLESDPEIERRYGDYGVPALILLDARGNEIIRRRGYLEPDWLYWLLATVAEDPYPESHR